MNLTRESALWIYKCSIHYTRKYAVLRIVYLIYKKKNVWGGGGDLSKICPDHPKTKENNMKIYFA